MMDLSSTCPSSCRWWPAAQLVAHVELLEDVVDGEDVRADPGALKKKTIVVCP